MKTERLLIFAVIVGSAVCLKCYFCKSNYVSNHEDERTKGIPHCGEEPYTGYGDHEVVCDIYYDNFGMTNPTFRMALSSTAKPPDHRRMKKRRNVNNRRRDLEASQKKDDEPNIEAGGTSAPDIHKKHPPKLNVYPYNLSSEPWGSQHVHHRASPYHCLTIHTINSTFPNRVCGLRYFLDCQMLKELTSEPLEPSSFITDCHECNTDLCNGPDRCGSAHPGVNMLSTFLLPHSFIYYFTFITS